jgi:6-pyruvoyltetrahydropterin/6-carboxytetrahydropterin synthase
MTITICKSFTFDSAHWLPHVPVDHKCHRMHGHTYRVELIAQGPLDARGMVLDYAELAEAWAPLHDALDHRLLNEIVGLENPTTEVLAPWIYDRIVARCSLVTGVRVYESSTTWCEIIP